MEITGISKSIDVERLMSKRATLLGIGTRQYVKVVFYVGLNQNWRAGKAAIQTKVRTIDIRIQITFSNEN